MKRPLRHVLLASLFALLLAVSFTVGQTHAAAAHPARPATTCQSQIWVAELFSGTYSYSTLQTAVTLYADVDRYNSAYCGLLYAQGAYRDTHAGCNGDTWGAWVTINGVDYGMTAGSLGGACGTWQYYRSNIVSVLYSANAGASSSLEAGWGLPTIEADTCCYRT